MNDSYDCPHCAAVTVVPEDEDFDGVCECCGNSIYTPPAETAPAAKVYTTTRDYITEVIHPALADLLEDYDVDGIAADMLVRRNVIDPRTGLTHANYSGFVERQDVWFWDVVAAHLDPDAGPEEPEVGDIYSTGDGLSIVTPHGRWDLVDEEVLTLIQGLSSMLKFRLTVPWSEGDESTILSRGRQLRRPTDLTAELANIGDTYA